MAQAKRSTPILILTARDTWEDKVIGLETGADDYLAKPFHEAELMARLKALLRRQSGQLSQVVTLNGVSLDEAGQRVCLEGETWRSLTATEFRLLRYLMLHPDRIHSKEQLLEQLYALEQDAAAPNLVEVYIARLRRYLGKSIIQTRRGQGISLLHIDRRSLRFRLLAWLARISHEGIKKAAESAIVSGPYTVHQAPTAAIQNGT
ncbi:hypothetical protein HSBAA_PA_2420 (plasmid) [Vreelandella sulfidaeris]|uniref:DNA-binding response regulator n=1 Tax=Vreelandella sulfidaeris TaxID=115553 RepID=A0A455UN07_9GAMM|nr:hypothetical protein HSBAA_PA_2420 [Halomonas sulfidaeris]